MPYLSDMALLQCFFVLSCAFRVFAVQKTYTSSPSHESNLSKYFPLTITDSGCVWLSKVIFAFRYHTFFYEILIFTSSSSLT